MTRADTLTERQEHLDGGLAAVRCARCGAEVRARKLSPQQTSVQWTGRAERSCTTLAAAAAPRPQPPPVATSPQHPHRQHPPVSEGRRVAAALIAMTD